MHFQHAPGIPKVLVGNRLHLAFKRQVAAKQAETYASRNNMSCFEISPLCDFNIRESFCELARMALHRNGMEHIWRSNKGNYHKKMGKVPDNTKFKILSVLKSVSYRVWGTFPLLQEVYIIYMYFIHLITVRLFLSYYFVTILNILCIIIDSSANF